MRINHFENHTKGKTKHTKRIEQKLELSTPCHVLGQIDNF